MDEKAKVTADGCEVTFGEAIRVMDPDIVADLITQEWQSEQQFVDAYLQLHHRNFGERFCVP
jgi:hypothetical protein